MERFLSECARYIAGKYSSDLAGLCLVFPNHRSGSFFLAYLQKQISKPVIAPEITTINDLILNLSSLNIAERLNQVSLLYESFITLSGLAESLDDFYLWGEMLLSDFNDADKYLIDPEKLFTNIADLKEVDTVFDYLSETQKETIREFWNTLGRWDRYEHQTHFINVWELLFPLYQKFTGGLLNQGVASEGMAYRAAVQKTIESGEAAFCSHKYIFIGLNALNNCEMTILSALKKAGKAEFLWDYDEYYLRDDLNGAGKFIRKNLELLPPPEDFMFDSRMFSTEKNIRIVAVASLHGQSQLIPYAIESFGDNYNDGHDNTAIVLADESLLFSALGAIPERISSVNVTMGYSVKNSVIYGFLSLLSTLLKNASHSASGETTFYYRNVVDILAHQLLAGIEHEKVQVFVQDINARNRFSIPSAELEFSVLHRSIFKMPDYTTDYADYLLNILGLIFAQLKTGQPDNKILPELIYATYTALEKLREVVAILNEKTGLIISQKVFFRLMTQYLGLVSIPFEGEPLSGLQVMGILETRCLDFENLIILGLNEGQWPKSGSGSSYIPFNIRKGFGLPGIDDQEAMSAYYFYRLIQRAKNIVITYNTSKEGTGAGELSRYGEQIRYLSPHKPVQSVLNLKFTGSPVAPVAIPGSSEAINRLYESLTSENPLSPSRINTYLSCRLRYYYRYIVGLPEPEEVTEEIDARLFGTIFHEAIEHIYRPLTGPLITKDFISEIRKNKSLINKEIMSSINRNFFKDTRNPLKEADLKGKAYLVAENLKTFVDRVLEIDEELAPFRILGLEKKLVSEIELTGSLKKIWIGGRIDRFDEKEGRTRIIDYKTGKVDSLDFDDVAALFDPEKSDKTKEILQAMTYCWILDETGQSQGLIRPGIYSLRNFFGEKYAPEITFRKSEFSFSELKEEFIAGLKLVVADMFNPSIAFTQTDKPEKCTYCPYKLICGKH